MQETFGLVALESQACGTPVVGIRGSYMDRIIFHEQESWARENTPEALADAIEELSGKKLSILGGARRSRRRNCTAGRGYLSNCFAFIAKSAQNTGVHDRNDRGRAIQHSQLSPVRPRGGPPVVLPNRFLGEPIDPVYEDRQLFADFLTTYYTDQEPESSFVLEIDGEIRGYLLGSRKPLRNQLYAFWQNVSLFFKALWPLFSL